MGGIIWNKEHLPICNHNQSGMCHRIKGNITLEVFSCHKMKYFTFQIASPICLLVSLTNIHETSHILTKKLPNMERNLNYFSDLVILL